MNRYLATLGVLTLLVLVCAPILATETSSGALSRSSEVTPVEDGNIALSFQDEMGLPRAEINRGIELSLDYKVPMKTAIALRRMGKQWSEVEAHLDRFSQAQRLVHHDWIHSAQTSSVLLHRQLAEVYDVAPHIVEGWSAMGPPSWGLVYLLSAADILGVSTENDLYEAQLRSWTWDHLKAALDGFAEEMGWSMDGLIDYGPVAVRERVQMSSVAPVSTWESVIDPGVLYGIDQVTPFQSYFDSQSESINAATGALIVSHTDLVLPGRGGLDFALTRVYMSNAANMYEPEIDVSYVCIGEEYWDPSTYEYYCDGYVEDHVYHSLPYVTTHLEGLDGLGVGWSFAFPSLEHRTTDTGNQVTLLHMGDGRVYEVDLYDSPSGLKGHPLKDMVYRRNNSYSNGQFTSATALELKDGTHYYFASGRLIGIRDRYRNTINFRYDHSSRLHEVTDTVGRKISFDYSSPTEIIVEARDGSDLLASITYELEAMEPYGEWVYDEYCDDDGCWSNEYWVGAPRGWYETYEEYIEDCEYEEYYECIEYTTVWVDAPLKKSLRRVIDPVDRVTTYDYKIQEAPFELWGAYSDGPLDNYYLLLEKIDYPYVAGHQTGSSEYEWIVMDRPCTEDWGCGAYISQPRISSRVDRIGGSRFDEATFTYIPWNHVTKRYATVQTRPSDNGSIVTRTEFNDKHMEVKEEVTWPDAATQSVVTRTRTIGYFNDEKTPKTETISYSNNPQTFQVQMGYDEFKNLIYQRDTLGRQAIYSYDREGYQLLKDARTRISLEPSSGGQDGVWERTAYGLSPDGRNTVSATQARSIRTLGSVTTSVGSHPGSMNRLGDWRWFVESSDRFDLSIYWFAGLLSGGSYEIYYREPGDLDWTLERRRPFSAFIFSESGTDQFTVYMPHQGDWEIRVFVPSLGSLSSLSLNRVTARHQPVTWQLEGDTIHSSFAYHPTYPSNLVQTDIRSNNDPVHRTVYVYESDYNAYVSEVHKSLGGEPGKLVQKAEYDGFGRIVKATQEQDGHSFRWKYEYDAVGRIERVDQPAVLDGSGWQEYTQEWQYDDVNGVVTLLSRDTNNPNKIYDQVRVYFDPLGRRHREARIIAGTWQDVNRLTYNRQGLVSKEELFGAPHASDVITTYEYDALGRPFRTIYGATRTTSPRNYTETRYLDGIEPRQEFIDTRGFKTISRFDQANRLVRTEAAIVSSPAEAITQYEYDLVGQLRKVIDPEGNQIIYVPGVGGSILEITSPAGRQVFTYDGVGNRKSTDYSPDDDLGPITYEYDAWNRLTKTTYPDGARDQFGYTFVQTGMQRVADTYDSHGWHEVQVTSSIDPLGRLQSETWWIAHNGYQTLEYDYDGLGRQTKVAFPTGTSASFNYDTSGRLGNMASSVTGNLASFVYQRSGFLSSILYGNNAQTTFTPDTRWRPASIQTTHAGSTLFNVSYNWDLEGNLTKINGHNQVYDGLNRLTSSVTPLPGGGTFTVGYKYDKAGNRTEEVGLAGTRVFNNVGGRLSSVTLGGTVEIFEYTTSGAIATRKLGGAVSAHYTYDAANRLRTVEQNGITTTYVYDAYGRLVKMVESQGQTTLSSTIRLPMETETAYEKVSEGSNVLERMYIRGNGMYIAKQERQNGGAWQTFYYHTDHLGSTRAVSGAHTSQLTYDPFGNLIDSDANADAHEHRFTGKPQDGTGLYYYGARFYDPALGRFISPDPAMDGLNWYVYVYNNPLKYVDPDGMESVGFGLQGCIHAAVGFCLGGSVHLVVSGWSIDVVLAGDISNTNGNLLGPSFTAGISASNADSSHELQGSSVVTGGGGNLGGLGASIEYETSLNPDETFRGVNIGVDLGPKPSPGFGYVGAKETRTLSLGSVVHGWGAWIKDKAHGAWDWLVSPWATEPEV